MCGILPFKHWNKPIKIVSTVGAEGSPKISAPMSMDEMTLRVPKKRLRAPKRDCKKPFFPSNNERK